MNTQAKLLQRRSVLSAIGAGSAMLFIPAWNESAEAADTITCVGTTPTTTEGPYWVDEKLFRSDIRTDPGTGLAREGVPLRLTIDVQNLNSSSGCSPVPGAYVDIWHCDAKGIYSDEPTYNPGGGTGTVNTRGQKFLRGYQITDDNGQVTFTTIFPGWYAGRTIHIHVRVRTYTGTTVLSNFVSQIFFDESVNNTVLANSAYSRSSSRDSTNASDGIYRVANATRMLASATGDTSSGYVASITVGAAFQVVTVAPTISSGGVSNAVSGVAGAAPGTWLSIYGTNFAQTERTAADADIVNNLLPTTLAGVSVQVNGKAAYVRYVNPNQINILSPDDVSTGPVAISVSNARGVSNQLSVTMQPVLPGLATLSKYVRAVRYPDGTLINGTGLNEPSYAVSAAAAPGDILGLYGTGFGKTQSPLDIGMVFSGAYPTIDTVGVTIGGQPADVLWAGLVGAGLYQINVKIPVLLGDGDHQVVASVAGWSSQSDALLKVAQSAKLASIESGLLAFKPAKALFG